MQRINVIGTGYVGLPLALLLAKHGKTVIAVDINEKLVEAINDTSLNIEESKLREMLLDPKVSKHLIAQTKPDFGDAFVISVPTPLDGRRKIADLQHVKNAVRSILPYLVEGNLIVIESTIPPGTTRGLIRDMIEKAGFVVGTDVFLAHCPERILPGNVFHEIVHNDRVIGGVDEESTLLAAKLYEPFLKGEMLFTDDLTAELTKLTENTYRDVNIALSNELCCLADSLGADFHHVRELANRHPRVHLLKPGIGVGGHCLPIDPWFLTEASPQHMNVVPAARNVNDGMPAIVAARIRKLVHGNPRVKIILLGVAYKPNTYDCRESPALKVLDLLRQDGYDVEAYDPMVDGFHHRPLAQIMEEAGSNRAVVLLVPHDALLEELNATGIGASYF